MSHREVCKWYNVCPIKWFHERAMIDKRWIERYCKGDYLSCVRYKMEEEGIYHPDNMMPDGTVDNKLL